MTDRANSRRNKMSRKLFAAAVILCGAALLCTAKAQDTSLQQLVEIFNQQVESIETEHAKKTRSLQSDYMRSLSKLEAMLQKKGKLDPLMAVQGERRRFAKDPVLGTSGVSEAVPELKRVQQAFLESLKAERIAKSQRVIALADHYKRSLGSLQSRLTKEGRFEEALRVREVANGVPSLPVVVSAESLKAASAGGAREAERKPAPVAERSHPEANTDLGKVEEDLARQTIRRKYEEYIIALGNRDFAKAVTYMDPRFTGRVGLDVIEPHPEKYAAPIAGMRAAGVEMDGGEVVVDLSNGTATNIPRFGVADSWKDGDPAAWVRVGRLVSEDGGLRRRSVTACTFFAVSARGRVSL